MNEENVPARNERMFRAVEFAAMAHRGQYRKGTAVPYIVHPLGAARTLIELGCEEDVVIAALLHDVVEDTKFTLEDIKKEFGERVAFIVEGCTEPHHNNEPWEVRKKHTIEFLKTAPVDVLLVACADKLDNIRSTKIDLQNRGEVTWLKFHKGKVEQQWYYTELAKIFIKRSEGSVHSVLFQQLKDEVDCVFKR
ncbi:HD domain-containing protein [Candidatus Woesearchaeota archaeon]|nr:HD domain-containing protein [Candidatus Woesearchaeota archaeon]